MTVCKVREPTGRPDNQTNLESALVKPVVRPGPEVGTPQRQVQEKHEPHQGEQMAEMPKPYARDCYSILFTTPV